jgi:Bacteriophage clamp loader A subunit
MSDNNYDWRYENSLSYNKEYHDVENIVEHKYVPWRTNKYFSNFPDTVYIVNQVNLLTIDSQLHFDYLFHTIRKRKRFFKRDKNEINNKINAIQCVYKYSYNKARVALKILSEEQLNQIIEIYDHIQENKVKIK